MGFAFHQLCPRYSGTLTPTAPRAVRLLETFTFFLEQGSTLKGKNLLQEEQTVFFKSNPFWKTFIMYIRNRK